MQVPDKFVALDTQGKKDRAEFWEMYCTGVQRMSPPLVLSGHAASLTPY
jgi:hypothetical protein